MATNPAGTQLSPAKPAPAWRVAIAFIVGCCGVITVFVAFGLRSDLAETRSQLEQFTTLPVWPQIPPDGLGIVEGQISGDSQVDSRGFVAWVRESYRSDGARSSSKWVLVESMIQPFVVGTPAGAVRVTNADYRLDDQVGEWSHEAREVAAPTLTSGASRIRGLLPGKPVTIMGRRTAADSVSALSVAGKGRGEYLSELAAKRDRISSAVTITSIVAPLALAYAIWELRRLWKRL